MTTMVGEPAAGGPSTRAPSQFFMFSTSNFADPGARDGVRAVLSRHTTERDYLSAHVLREFPEIGQRVARARRYVLPTSVAEVQRESAKGCGADTPGLILYNGEHWPGTPTNEQADLPAAIARAKEFAAGSGCHEFGVAPDGAFAGISPATCSYALDSAIHRLIDWTGVALFDVQAQSLLSDRCNATAGVAAYVAFVSAIARDVRKNANPPSIVAQLSFRHTPPERMATAIQALRGVVDGFYIAYPINVGPACKYCSPDNLEKVMTDIRSD